MEAAEVNKMFTERKGNAIRKQVGNSKKHVIDFIKIATSTEPPSGVNNSQTHREVILAKFIAKQETSKQKATIALTEALFDIFEVVESMPLYSSAIDPESGGSGLDSLFSCPEVGTKNVATNSTEKPVGTKKAKTAVQVAAFVADKLKDTARESSSAVLTCMEGMAKERVKKNRIDEEKLELDKKRFELQQRSNADKTTLQLITSMTSPGSHDLRKVMRDKMVQKQMTFLEEQELYAQLRMAKKRRELELLNQTPAISTLLQPVVASTVNVHETLATPLNLSTELGALKPYSAEELYTDKGRSLHNDAAYYFLKVMGKSQDEMRAGLPKKREIKDVMRSTKDKRAMDMIASLKVTEELTLFGNELDEATSCHLVLRAAKEVPYPTGN
ncbi:predicted protein [Chaetoceros tenuissimus]|uniref:Uncharacterized protein n=1 Tax=Chaetoceros tenuissimus TaxID=426638 RepID=A0AAD3CT16_9STRA|nr:predicted protein [Chaetoceros tenuissimus]